MKSNAALLKSSLNIFAAFFAALFFALVFCALFAQARPVFGQSSGQSGAGTTSGATSGTPSAASSNTSTSTSSNTSTGTTSNASTTTAADTADETAAANASAASDENTTVPADTEAGPTQLGRSDTKAQTPAEAKKPAEEFLLPPKQDGTPTPEPYEIGPPYTIGGLQPWAYFTVRFLAVTVGVFPFSVLLTSVGFDIYRTAIHNGDPRQDRYYPLVAGANKEPYSSEDVATVLAAAAGISVAVGITDLIIALVKYSRKRAINELFTRTVP